MPAKKARDLDIVIVGGLGYIGLPLGLVFADKGFDVCLYDISRDRAGSVRQGIMPFIEYGAQPILKRVLKDKRLSISHDINVISRARYVIIAIGTPIDKNRNTNQHAFLDAFKKLKRYLRNGQTIIVRSTIYPQTCRKMYKILRNEKIGIAYCPERIVQGYAIKELKKLPQIVSGIDSDSTNEAAKLFKRISSKIIKTSLEEAELIKFFTNAWRYIQFAITNELYMISDNYGVEYDKIRSIMCDGYERMANLPSAGFTAGPCLFKDTLYLTAFNRNNFKLGRSAMTVNEGLPGFIVNKLKKKFNLKKKVVGILGMAFKADIDDKRDSLSYKLLRILKSKGARVLCSDEYIDDPSFVSSKRLLKECDIVIIGAPHSAYRNIRFPKNVEVVDLWKVTKKAKR
ncbi:MAG: nucleotide sugar dehydrogenase [Candidatus Omnitrophica bacterium]|nr:nucleotide sugar dehydrogenase [Candidatus Omnitrophota bacterium]